MFITLSDPHKRGNCFTSCWPFRIQLVRTSCGCLFGEEVVTECFGGICEWCLWILGRGFLWLARLLLAHCWFFGCSFLWFVPLSWRRVFRCCFESYQCYALKDDHWFFQFFPDCYLTSYSNIAPSPSILTWPPASTPPVCRFHLRYPNFPYLDVYLEKPMCTVVSLGKGSTLVTPLVQSCVSVLSAGRS